MKVHFLGIAGSGASACAAIAQAQGFEVTGCDLEPNNEFTTQFKPSQLLKGHSSEHLESVDILAITPAITSLDPNNPELVEARNKNIPILTWQQFLGEYLTKDKFVIAVCGTHGKSTTTAMIAKLLDDSGLDPTVELGAIVPSWQTNYRIGNSKYFVVEADEFNDNFLHLKPDINVVTNIEMDHPEYFKDLEEVKNSFRKFLGSTKQTIIANLSDPGVKEVLSSWLVQDPQNDKVIDYSKDPIDFPLQIPGDFNILNATAAYQVGQALKLDPKVIEKSLGSYTGVGRRFEYLGDFKGAKVYSDFGHHPTEIEKTMQAAREKFPDKNIWLIYQPHMFSRTKALFEDFVKVFKELEIDKGVILDIYPSREIDTGVISSKELVETIAKENITYSTWEDLKKELQNTAKEDDILFFMGAGDTDKWARELIDN